MNISKSQILKRILTGCFLFFAFAAIYGIPTGYTSNVQSLHAYQLDQKDVLVERSDYIFVGHVLTDIGNRGIPTTSDSDIPNTQFKVKVENVIKGDVDNVVTVNQYGGIVKDKGLRSLLLFNNDPLLEKKETYLFFTNLSMEGDLNGNRYGAEQKWQTLVAPGFGAIKIENEDQMNTLIQEYLEVVSRSNLE